jgi:peptidoglycan-associated lipoprotein
MRSTTLAIAAAAVMVIGGCAKTPATTGATAPAPTGIAGAAGTSGATRAANVGGSTRATGGTNTAGRAEVAGFKAIAALQDVHFDFDKYDIRPDAAKLLDANAAWLRDNRGHLLLVEGHCDERGTVEYNLALGERRAKATQNYLASHGVDTARISIVSYGKERPQCAESTEACWAKNRRAHFLVKPQ